MSDGRRCDDGGWVACRFLAKKERSFAGGRCGRLGLGKSGVAGEGCANGHWRRAQQKRDAEQEVESTSQKRHEVI